MGVSKKQTRLADEPMLRNYWTDFEETSTIRNVVVRNGAICDIFLLAHPKWSKLVLGPQKPLQTSPCSESTGPISMKPCIFDASWCKTVLFLIFLYWFTLSGSNWSKPPKNVADEPMLRNYWIDFDETFTIRRAVSETVP